MVKKDILPKSGAGQWGTSVPTKKYMQNTPGQDKDVKTFKDWLTQHK